MMLLADPKMCPSMQASALGVLQGPQDAAVTVETAPLLEVPTVRSPWRKHPPAQLFNGPLLAQVQALLHSSYSHCKDVVAHVLCWLQALINEENGGIEAGYDEHPVATVCR